MAKDDLTRYLNDHMAGATGAVKLMEHLEAAYPGTPVQRAVAGVRADVEADSGELEAIMQKLDVSQSSPRKAAGWLAERAAQLKLYVDDPSGGPFRLLETLEAIALGIEGKLSLWRSLIVASEAVPALQGIDYERLTQRAGDQHGRIEAQRIEAARAALQM